MSTPLSSGTTTASLDIEQLIYDIAEQPSNAAFQQLYRSLVNRKLFLPVESESVTPALTQIQPGQVQPGQPVTGDDDTAIKIKNVEGPKGEPFVPLVTTEGAPILTDAYVGIHWLEALALVLKRKDAVGILLQGKNSWIYFYKPQIENILRIYGTRKPEKPQA